MKINFGFSSIGILLTLTTLAILIQLSFNFCIASFEALKINQKLSKPIFEPGLLSKQLSSNKMIYCKSSTTIQTCYLPFNIFNLSKNHEVIKCTNPSILSSFYQSDFSCQIKELSPKNDLYILGNLELEHLNLTQITKIFVSGSIKIGKITNKDHLTLINFGELILNEYQGNSSAIKIFSPLKKIKIPTNLLSQIIDSNKLILENTLLPNNTIINFNY